MVAAFFVVDAAASTNALLGRDWIHACYCIPSSLHQALLFWNGDEVEVVWAETKPFIEKVHAA